ncbi:hypothetical protein CMUS01_02347 [Colletotrichum musicola]|uniref:Uncharacterized protein n=1 Tax=Colletotrichum musicola TaxID=2175873 RepID=A0A8H6NV72_9PEZI|nr:hypothetical protein CMUS01_02347 [Colletotrichum musicola]
MLMLMLSSDLSSHHRPFRPNTQNCRTAALPSYSALLLLSGGGANSLGALTHQLACQAGILHRAPRSENIDPPDPSSSVPELAKRHCS